MRKRRREQWRWLHCNTFTPDVHSETAAFGMDCVCLYRFVLLSQGTFLMTASNWKNAMSLKEYKLSCTWWPIRLKNRTFLRNPFLAHNQYLFKEGNLCMSMAWNFIQHLLFICNRIYVFHYEWDMWLITNNGHHETHQNNKKISWKFPKEIM